MHHNQQQIKQLTAIAYTDTASDICSVLQKNFAHPLVSHISCSMKRCLAKLRYRFCTWSAKLKLALIFKFTFISYFQVCQAFNDRYTLCTLRNNVQEFSYRKLGQSNCPIRRWSHSKKCELRQIRLASAACACRTC